MNCITPHVNVISDKVFTTVFCPYILDVGCIFVINCTFGALLRNYELVEQFHSVRTNCFIPELHCLVLSEVLLSIMDVLLTNSLTELLDILILLDDGWGCPTRDEVNQSWSVSIPRTLSTNITNDWSLPQWIHISCISCNTEPKVEGRMVCVSDIDMTSWCPDLVTNQSMLELGASPPYLTSAPAHPYSTAQSSTSASITGLFTKSRYSDTCCLLTIFMTLSELGDY